MCFLLLLSSSGGLEPGQSHFNSISRLVAAMADRQAQGGGFHKSQQGLLLLVEAVDWFFLVSLCCVSKIHVIYLRLKTKVGYWKGLKEVVQIQDTWLDLISDASHTLRRPPTPMFL